MYLFSTNNWWKEGDPVICEVNRQTKNHLMECCKVNEIKYKKSWNKKKFITLLLTHNPEKTYKKMDPMDLSIEELKELIERKNER